jgi:hypothetical protein
MDDAVRMKVGHPLGHISRVLQVHKWNIPQAIVKLDCDYDRRRRTEKLGSS